MTRLSIQQVRQLEKKGKRAPKPVTLPLVQAQWDAKLFTGGVWIQIPFSPPSMNEWKNWHWGKQAKYKKMLTDAIGKLVLYFGLPQFERATIQMIHYFETTRRRNPQDNYAPKFLMDALVQARVLVDDNGELVTVPVPELKVDRERPRTEVFVWKNV